MEEAYAVIDMKSFYASCECADRGLDIFSTPLVVADPERTEATIVMSCTPYLKEKYHCSNVCRVKDLPYIPNMIMAKPRMAFYLKQSARIVSIFLDFISEEDLHVYSIDESFLRLTPYLSLYNCTPEELVTRIQKRIKEETGMLATAGIGPNMFLAKVCLDNEGKKKPPYIAHWYQANAKEKLWNIHPIDKIWGIGHGISSHLDKLGIRNLEALAKADDDMLKQEFGIIGKQLKNLSNGIDNSDITSKYAPQSKNLSIGQTLIRDYSLSGAKLVLREMNDDLCFRLRQAHYKTRCVSLFCRYGGGYGGFSHQKSLDISSDDTDTLYKVIEGILLEHASPYPIRGLGICFSGLCRCTSSQFSLFDTPENEQERRNLDMALDLIHKKYGKNSILRATSLCKDSTVKQKHMQIGGHAL